MIRALAMPGVWMLFGTLLSIALVVLAVLQDRTRARRERRAKLRERPVMGGDEWYGRFWRGHPAPRGVVDRVAGALAAALGCEPCQLYPDDRFDGGLGIRRRYGRLGIDEDDELLRFEAELDDLGGAAAGPDLDVLTLGELVAICSNCSGRDDGARAGPG